MAGHSKWANIKHRKERQDAKRGKLWTRLIREVTVAARMGADANANAKLRLCLDKAANANMPKDMLQRAIARGVGMTDSSHYEEIRYEGYGIGGAAVIIDCLTDNRQRTVAEVRHAFTKYGGNLGQDGSVAFLFTHCGRFLFSPGIDEDAVMQVALEAGADDVISDDEGGVEVVCSVSVFSSCRDLLEQAQLKSELAEITMKPSTEVMLHGEQAQAMIKLLDALEELDDVQEVFSNAIINR